MTAAGNDPAAAPPRAPPALGGSRGEVVLWMTGSDTARLNVGGDVVFAVAARRGDVVASSAALLLAALCISASVLRNWAACTPEMPPLMGNAPTLLLPFRAGEFVLAGAGSDGNGTRKGDAAGPEGSLLSACESAAGGVGDEPGIAASEVSIPAAPALAQGAEFGPAKPGGVPLNNIGAAPAAPPLLAFSSTAGVGKKKGAPAPAAPVAPPVIKLKALKLDRPPARKGRDKFKLPPAKGSRPGLKGAKGALSRALLGTFGLRLLLCALLPPVALLAAGAVMFVGGSVSVMLLPPPGPLVSRLSGLTLVNVCKFVCVCTP